MVRQPEKKANESNRCGDDESRKKRERRAEKRIGAAQFDLQPGIELHTLSRVNQSGLRPIADHSGGMHSFFVLGRVPPHDSRPRTRATKTSATVTIVADTTRYASAIISESTDRRTRKLIPRYPYTTPYTTKAKRPNRIPAMTARPPRP